MRLRVLIGIVMLELTSVSTSSFAFDVGDTVIVIRDGKLKIEGKDGDEVSTGLMLKVEAVNGNWLWVSNGHPGWLDAQFVATPDKALPILNEMIRQNPGNAGLYNGRASIWLEKKEYDFAISDSNETIRLAPSAAAYLNRGRTRAYKGDLDKAIADYTECLKLNSQDAKALNNRGMAWMEKKEFDIALTDFNGAIRIDATYVSPYSSRGICWLNKNNYEKAIADFTTAIELNPKYARAYRGRAKAYDGLHQHEKALPDYEVYARLSPGLDGLNGYAWVLATCPNEKLRNGEKAVELGIKACELSEWKVWNHVGTLAAAYAEKGDFEAAIKWEKKALELAEGDNKAVVQKNLDLLMQKKSIREE